MPGPHRDGYGLVHDGPLPVAGQASDGGTVVLSWADALKGGRDAADGRNLVFHEFAHQLDVLDGEAGGMPPLPDRASERRWHEVVAEEFARRADDSRSSATSTVASQGRSLQAFCVCVALQRIEEARVRLEEIRENQLS